jgi:hypothetical protein
MSRFLFPLFLPHCEIIVTQKSDIFDLVDDLSDVHETSLRVVKNLCPSGAKAKARLPCK